MYVMSVGITPLNGTTSAEHMAQDISLLGEAGKLPEADVALIGSLLSATTKEKERAGLLAAQMALPPGWAEATY